MSYLVLARKYRPKTFDEVVNQEHVTRTVSNAISSGRVAHAILFSGPRGTGKTTVARILAKAMNCKQGPTPTPCNSCRSCLEITSGNAVDVLEIDGASNNGVDHIRDLRENVKYMPAHSSYKIYIIDEVHMLSVQAFNALLKTLEEPPPHVMFIFATTEPHKIPITILSRCQRHDFRRIDLDAITTHLKSLCTREGIDISDESINIIAREAGGSMRDGLSLLDQVMICSQEKVIRDEQVLDILGVVDRKLIFDMSAAILRGDISELLNILDQIFEHGHNLKEVYVDVIEHFRNLLVVKMAKRVDKLVEVPSHERLLMIEQVKDISAFQLSRIMDILFKEDVNVKLSSRPKLAIEMAFIRLFETKPVLPIDVLIEKLDTLQKNFADGSIPQHAAVAFQPVNSQPINEGRSIPVESTSEALTSEKSHTDLNAAPAESPDKTWERIVDSLSEQNHSLGAALSKSTFINLDGENLKIEVNGNGFNQKIIIKNKVIVEKACNDFLKKKINLVISSKEIPAAETGQNIINEAERLRKEALNHPTVTAALDIFRGKIVDVKILQNTQRR